MKALLTPTIVLIFFVLVRAADLAITAAIGRSFIRAICYGLVALAALIVMIVALLGA